MNVRHAIVRCLNLSCWVEGVERFYRRSRGEEWHNFVEVPSRLGYGRAGRLCKRWIGPN